MKAARLVVLGVAVAAGGIAAYLAAGRKAPPAPAPVAVAPPMPTVEVLVAKSDLSRGQVIQNQEIGWQTWPKNAANAEFYPKIAAARCHQGIRRCDRSRDNACRRADSPPDVVMAKGSGFMAAILPKGMRAVAVDISAVSSAGGFILPDDRVDLVLTHHDRSGPSGNEKTISDTILRNVRVLAVDQSVDEKADTKVILGKTATLELTEGQAETLEQAKQLGTISLTLRSILDSAASGPEGDEGHDQAINTIRFGVSAGGTGR